MDDDGLAQYKVKLQLLRQKRGVRKQTQEAELGEGLFTWYLLVSAWHRLRSLDVTRTAKIDRFHQIRLARQLCEAENVAVQF